MPERTKAPVAADGGLRDRCANRLYSARRLHTPVEGRRRRRSAIRSARCMAHECTGTIEKSSAASPQNGNRISITCWPQRVCCTSVSSPAPAIGDPRLGHPVVQHRVVGGDVLRPDHAGHLQLAQFVVHPELLPRRHHQVAVRQHLRHHAGQPQRHRLVALDLSRCRRCCCCCRRSGSSTDR